VPFYYNSYIILQTMQVPFLNKIKSTHIKKYVANTGWVFADFFIKMVLNVFVGIYVARYLLPEGLGKLSYATTYLQLLQPIAHIGLTAIIIRDLVKFKDQSNVILGTAFVFKTWSTVIAFIGIIIITLLVDGSSESTWYVIIASASILVSPIQVIDFYFQSQVKSKYIVYSQQISTVSVSLLRLLGVALSFSIIWFVWMIVLEAIISIIMLMVFYRLNKQQIKLWKYDNKIAKAFLSELWPVILSGFFVALYLRIDQLMIFKMMDAKALGIYAAAIKLCEPFYVVASLICTSLFPAIVTGLEISRIEYQLRLQRLFNILTWLAIGTSIFVHFTAPFLIKIIYGTAFNGSETILQVYFWASIFVFQGIVAGQAYSAEKKQLYGTIYTAAGALINIVLNLVLIPKMGVMGAAVSTLVAYSCSSIILNAAFKSTRPIFKQQLLAYTALFTKPKALLQSFKVIKK
jgi:O-antigen/teichoic acid export membrane protein